MNHLMNVVKACRQSGLSATEIHSLVSAIRAPAAPSRVPTRVGVSPRAFRSAQHAVTVPGWLASGR